MDNIPPILQPLARRAIRILQDTIPPFTSSYFATPDTNSSTTFPPVLNRPSSALPSTSTSSQSTLSPPRPASTSTMPPPKDRHPQMSTMYVPVLISPTCPHSRYHTPTSTSSRSSSPFLLAGSELVVPTKVRLSPSSTSKVPDQLKEILEKGDLKYWPVHEESAPAKTKYRHDKHAKTELEESAVYAKKMTEEERRTEQELLKKWNERKDRDISDRVRVQDGLEDEMDNEMLENMWGMRPTLERFNTPSPDPSKAYFRTAEQEKGHEQEERSRKLVSNDSQTNTNDPRLAEKSHQPPPSRNKKKNRSSKMHQMHQMQQVSNDEESRKQYRAPSKPVFQQIEDSDDDTLAFQQRK